MKFLPNLLKSAQLGPELEYLTRFGPVEKPSKVCLNDKPCRVMIMLPGQK